tara:strand:- start:185 stop:583 length:399 start_codon:yes stop_codon:yes gene_type:complete
MDTKFDLNNDGKIDWRDIISICDCMLESTFCSDRFTLEELYTVVFDYITTNEYEIISPVNKHEMIEKIEDLTSYARGKNKRWFDKIIRSLYKIHDQINYKKKKKILDKKRTASSRITVEDIFKNKREPKEDD